MLIIRALHILGWYDGWNHWRRLQKKYS